MDGTRLTILECGHTTLDRELVVTGHPNPEVLRHLMPCAHTAGADGKIAHPIYAWVVEHPKARILVDTGMSETFRTDWKANHYRDALAYDPGEHGLFTQRLKELDFEIGKFSDVIITHLHTDHAGNLPLLAKTDARIIVHEDELRGCVLEKGALVRDDLVTLWGATSPQGFTRRDFGCLLPNRATTVFGDQELYRGVWTVSLPGHTWGTMGVAVNLPHAGWMLIASDHIYLSASFGDPFIGNILNQDPRHWARSAVKVRRLMEKYSMRVLPGHDNKVIVPDKDKGFVIEELQTAYD